MKKITKYQSFWPLMIFLAILLVNGITSGGAFFQLRMVDGHLYGRLIDIVRNGSRLMLLATGMTMVLATGGTDISVGSVMALAGAVAGTLLVMTDNVALAIIVATLVGTVCGLWNGFLIAKIKIQPIVGTMILMVAGRGLAQLITNGKNVSITNDAFNFLNAGYIFALPFQMYIVLFFVIITLLFTKKTAFGLFVESIGINANSSRLAGIKVDRMKLAIYAFSGTMAAIAGMMESASIKMADANNTGVMIELDAILAVAIGGTSLAGGRFSIPASLVGALIIQSITTTVYAMGVPAAVTQVVKAAIVIVICLVQSRRCKELIARIGRREARV